jgi:hypothetical protein
MSAELARPDVTHPMRPPPRPTLPPRNNHRWRRRSVAVAIAMVLAALAATATVVGRSNPRPTGPFGSHPSAVSRGSAALTRSAARRASAAGRATAAAIGPSADVVAAALARLDSWREQAFAQRRPELLSTVYTPGPLLAQDSALLTRITPPGCGLQGVHTTYSDVASAVSISAGSLVVTVVARLTPSTLMCHARAAARAPGAGPARLRIELVRVGADYRIAREDLLP